MEGSEGRLCTTVRVLKTPKTESSVRKIFIPKSVAEMLEKLKASQEEMKSISDFRNVTKTRSSIHLTIVTTYGLEQNKHSGHVQSVVTTEDLFQPTWR